MTLCLALTLRFSDLQWFQMMAICFQMCPMHPRTGRPHLGQFLTLNKPSAPARIMISLAIRARTHIRRRKHIHIQTHTVHACVRACAHTSVRGCVAHARALAREHNSIPVSSHPLLPLRPLPESPPSHPLPRTTLLQYSLIVQVWPPGF